MFFFTLVFVIRHMFVKKQCLDTHLTGLLVKIIIIPLAGVEEEFEDTRLVIRMRKSKDIHYNGQRHKDKNDQQNSTQKTKEVVMI